MKLHIVITHFIEPWEYVWEIYAMCVRALQGHEFQFIVYHRGGEETAWNGQVALPPNVEIIPLENIGRESYVVHHHICNNYQQLPERLIFIPANWRSREYGVRHVLQNIRPDGFFPPPAYVPWSSEQFFQLDKWHGLTEVNRSEVIKQEYTPASIRPYGRWYEVRIPVPYKDLLVLNGVISIPRQSVLRYPQTMYEDWLLELQQSGPNPEIGHYWERTWFSLFS